MSVRLVTKTLTWAISLDVLMAYLASMILVLRPFQWYHDVTMTFFDWFKVNFIVVQRPKLSKLACMLQTLTDKNKTYKQKLEKEETTKRQHMKILCKTQEIKILEKDNLIGNLESMVEELEIQILQLGQNVNGKRHTHTTHGDLCHTHTTHVGGIRTTDTTTGTEC